MAGDNCELQSIEIANLKGRYGNTCRVITSVGEFAYIVAIQPSDLNLTFKFQLSASYPMATPGVIVRSNFSKLAVEEIEMLQSVITSSAEEHHGSAMIHDLIQSARTWLADHMHINNPPVPEATQAQESSNVAKSKKTSRTKKHQQKDKEETDCKKKLSMKTASDVISRIVWDEDVPANCFTVGYIDRFLGIVENNFTAFSWEDLASVDYAVLAIPQHRIQYFKYNDVKVWDKKERLDNVFGSTGSGVTITEVMTKYKSEKPQKQTPTFLYDSDADNGDNTDDNDGIVVNLGTPFCPTDDGHWENKLRPNYFLCVRITDAEIIEKLEALQESILEVEPRYDECCVKSSELHVTICTLGLDTMEQVSRARQALEGASIELSMMAQRNINLTVKGVSNFYNRVLYGQVQHGQDFADFSEHIRMTFCERGVEIRDTHDYVPHMTIMKVTRLGERRLRQSTIDPDICERVTDMYFGTQAIDSIHLCSMKEKAEDGFYRSAASIDLREVEI